MHNKSRFQLFVLTALLIGAASLPAETQGLKGNWTFVLPTDSEEALWLLSFEQEGDKWSGKVAATATRLPKAELSGFKVTDKGIRFTLTAPGLRYPVSIQPPKGNAKTLYGTIEVSGRFTPVELHATDLTNLDRRTLDLRKLSEAKEPIKVIGLAGRLLQGAKNVKAKPEEIKQWATQVVDASAHYGEGFQREALIGLVRVLNEIDGVSEVSLPFAEKLGAMIKEQDLPEVQTEIYTLWAKALSRAGKATEAEAVAGKIANITYDVRVAPFSGRASKSDRVVLVELFTGAECPPCVAADLAFDGLTKTYKPSEVVFLQYHVHIPRPDPLTSPASVERMKYYSELYPTQVRGTPSILFNGTPGAPGGGGQQNGQLKYKQYNNIIQPSLEKESRAKLKATAKREGDSVSVSVDVSELKDAAKTTMLRIVLVEEEVKYEGGNKLDRHHYVVRDFVGGAEGTSLTEKSFKKTFTADVSKLRKDLAEYLDKFHKSERGPFPNNERPLEMKELKAIVFIQDDNSGEILQAAQAEVK